VLKMELNKISQEKTMAKRLPGEFSIRAALPEDKETVLKFCRHTWEWGDYVPQVWDVWLSDPQGRLLVATIDNQPVAIDASKPR